jgi:hypothetical protein
MPDGATITALDPLLDIDQAARVLTAELGRDYTYDQIRRAADLQKLPFFKDPIAGKRLIRRSQLLAIFAQAERTPASPAPRHRAPGKNGRPRK